MKQLLTLLFLCLFLNFASAQEDKTVTLTVSGQGKTQDDAKQSALRNAIEQAFGTFVSSNTTILNDALVKDEIISLSNGNIQKYDILTSSTLPDGSTAVIVKAVVSVSKLISFSESKGVTIEFKGGLFAINVKQQMLNEQAEIKSIWDMLIMLNPVAHQSIDYVISSKDPQSRDNMNKDWVVPLVIDAKANKNMDFLFDYLRKNLSLIALQADEVNNYNSINKKVYPINLEGVYYYFRTRESRTAIILFFNEFYGICNNFIISNGFTKRGLNQFKKYSSNFSYCPLSEKSETADIKALTRTNNTIYKLNMDESYEKRDINYKLRYIPIINSIKSETSICNYTIEDLLSLDEIEKISGYSISPKYPKSKIGTWYSDGIIINEDSTGKGLVAAIVGFVPKYVNFEERLLNINVVNKLCKDYNFNGLKNWRLPTKDELMLLYKNVNSIRLGTLLQSERHVPFVTTSEKIGLMEIYSDSSYNINESEYIDTSTNFLLVIPVHSY